MAANRIQLQAALIKPYDRILFAKDVLSPVFGSAFSAGSSLVPASVQPNKSEQEVINTVSVYGNIKLEDNKEVTCYEIVLQPKVRIEQSKVAIQHYIRKLLTAGQAALVNFVPSPSNQKKDRARSIWRLTLVAKDSAITDTGVTEKLTHPKRYTYLLGPGETCKTAAERFETLSTEKEVSFQALVNAFSVEKLSKAFFNEYTLHYENFIEHLSKTAFKKSVFKGDDKAIRDFSKKLLGRIVFLYFVQKKGWLGASDTDYKDGMIDFMKSLFISSGGDEDFYNNWLSILFFETLNKPRPNDDFKMPNGKKVKVPFLNGGLFDREDHDDHILTFKAKLFHNPDFEDAIVTEKNRDNSRGFLDFLNAFNFTVHEDSPDDHTVAVDPEMLGHIFENLLEGHKEKGTFYTPKEIVYYMCQESLTEHLATHLSKQYTVYRELGNAQVELFGNETRQGQLKMIEELGDKALNRDHVAFIVKHKDISQLTKDQLRQIDKLLTAVKICDPAIGSGAFPMGLLQEIYGIKEVIAYELRAAWKPAEVKENIIQNSIYGVDIEKGAVDIARLRFWLSLVVDEEKPRALPNLDYKIVVGDSLASKFENQIIEIDWERKTSVGKSDEFVKNIQRLLKEIAEKQKTFFKPDLNDKRKLHREIRNLKLELLINQISFNKNVFESKNKIIIDSGLGLTSTERKKNLTIDEQGSHYKQLLNKLQLLKKDNDKVFEHFDWRLDFPEVLNPNLVLDDKQRGFDIVIGNPPYIKVQSIPKDLTDYFKRKFHAATGKYDIYVIFIEQSLKLLKHGGNVAFINPHRFLIAEYGFGLREVLFKKRAISKLIYFGVKQIFETATTYTGLFFMKENSESFQFSIPESKNLNSLDYSEKKYSSPSFSFSVEDNNDPILSRIIQYKKVSEIFDGVYQGLIPMGDDIHVLEGEIIGDYFVGLSKALDQTVKIESKLMKPVLKGENIQRYQKLTSDIYIYYPHFTNKKGKTEPLPEAELKSKYPLGYKYILNFKSELVTKKVKYKTNPKFWYALHRSREQYIFENPKLITPQLQNHPSFAFDKDGFYADAGGYMILEKKGDLVSLDAYLAVFNSKLFYYFITKTSTPYNNNYYYFKTNYIEPFCIPTTILDFNSEFKSLVNYVIFLKTQTFSGIEDKFMSTYFEQILDGMVYELYFPELLKKYQREIIQHLGVLPDLQRKNDDTNSLQIVKDVFARLNGKENPIRINLFYMNSIPEIAIIEGKNASN